MSLASPQHLSPLETARLRIVPATAALARMALAEPARWAAALEATLAPDWPPEHIDDGALRFTIKRLDASPAEAGWWSWYFVLRGNAGDMLIGVGGFKGPPDANGAVELGYSVVASHQNRGYATEAVAALIGWAGAHPGVRRIVGETLPALVPSARVLEKLGFALVGAGSEPGVIRYERAA